MHDPSQAAIMVRDDEVKDHDEMVRDFVAMSGASAELVRRDITLPNMFMQYAS